MAAPGALRVLHLCAGNLYGGVERIVAECAVSRALCPSMTPAFAVSFEGRLSKEIEAAGARCANLGEVRVSRPWTIVRFRRTLAQLLETDRPHAVICHSSWMFALAAPVVRGTSATLALWLHDRVSGGPWAERWAALTAPDLVISNSRFTAETVPALFSVVPRAVLYAPVGEGDRLAADARRSLRASLGADDDTPVILIASRLEAWKGHRDLLAAAARVVEPWRLWIAGRPQRAGEDAYERGLHALAASAGIADRVRFLGERTDMPAVMRAADIHCQPNSGAEPFGLAFVEALYAGLPIITTAMGGAMEIVTDRCGLLVPPGDGAALEHALGRLVVDESARVALGAAGPARARDLCDPAQQLGRLSHLLTGSPAAAQVSA
jgi:glycosyltransferase involved in cell wall biosynthesis